MCRLLNVLLIILTLRDRQLNSQYFGTLLLEHFLYDRKTIEKMKKKKKKKKKKSTTKEMLISSQKLYEQAPDNNYNKTCVTS